MRRPSMLAIAAFALIGMPGCARHAAVQTVSVPPRIDLKQHEVIGIVEFRSTSEGKLGPLTTRRFIEGARRDQGLVRIVDLGTKAQALKSVGRDRWDAETFRALGRERGLATIFMGELNVSDIRPDIRILASIGSGHVTAQVEAALTVQLVETATGASLWSASGGGTRSVGQISVFSGRKFAFDADDPERAYGELVNTLVEQTTRDFRVSWERR